MTKPISAAAVSSIEAAISRLIASGDVQARFTIARLASEAGLSRATLYRAPELLERFRIAVASHHREVKSPPSPTDRVHQLEAEIAACAVARPRSFAPCGHPTGTWRNISRLSASSCASKSNGLLGFRANHRNRDALQRLSRLPRRHDVDESFPARIARAGSGSLGPTG
jgi:hypothetical protein